MLTQERLKELLHYDPETGVFTRKVITCNTVKVGDIAGSVSKKTGYLRCNLENKLYLMHRIAFLYVEGYLPEYQVDHRNGKREDNRWCNLRHVTRICNLQNTNINKNNTSGFPGVCWVKDKKKFIAYCKLNGKSNSLGYHLTKLDAALARLTWEVQCCDWVCNYRSELLKAIKSAWPEFNERCLL